MSSFCVLVLHGPNLASLADGGLNSHLSARARALGATLVTAQANGEEGLLDALYQHLPNIQAVIVNPGVLAPAAYALAEGISQLKVPVVEVLLAAPVADRGPSRLTGVVKEQLHGQQADGYLRALELLVPADAALPARPRVQPPNKTVGRAPAVDSATPSPTATTASSGLTRAQVVEHLNARLSGSKSPAEVATWARTQWTALQQGAKVESPEFVDAALLTLMTGAQATDAALIAHLAKLS